MQGRHLSPESALQIIIAIEESDKKKETFGQMMDHVRALLRGIIAGDKEGRDDLVEKISDSLYRHWGKTGNDPRTALLGVLGAGEEPVPDSDSPEHASVPDDLLGTTPDAAFARKIFERPGDSDPRLIWADSMDERGQARGRLLYLEEEAHSQPTSKRRNEINAEKMELHYSHLIQTFERYHLAWPGDWQWDKKKNQESRPSFPHDALREFSSRSPGEQADILQTLLRLPEQFADQQRFLDELKLLEEKENQPGITGIDEKWHAMPTYGESGSSDTPSLLRHLYAENPDAQTHRALLFRKSLQGFTELSITPFALPLSHFIETWGDGLKRYKDLLPGGLDTQQPVWTWRAYNTEPLVYDPQNFGEHHGGRTKEQLLSAGNPAWHIHLLERGIHDLPRPGKGSVIAGRPQVEAGKTPRDYLPALVASKETGLDPETYILRFLQSLEREGCVLDSDTYSYLTGAFFHTSRDVPNGDWSPYNRRARLDVLHPGYHDADGGARVAVRVM